MAASFPDCPAGPAPQIRRVSRTALFALFAFLAPALGAAEPLPARFNQVEIKPTTTSLFIASVTMTMPPFVRQNAVFASTYSARVFPYFFWSESGRIWIEVPEGKLRQVERGEAVDFTGRGVNESGERRRIEGHATPTGPAEGKIRVRVFVSRRIYLTFDTTYVLTGTAARQEPVKPR
jgi:hypothetical protein